MADCQSTLKKKSESPVAGKPQSVHVVSRDVGWFSQEVRECPGEDLGNAAMSQSRRRSCCGQCQLHLLKFATAPQQYCISPISRAQTPDELRCHAEAEGATENSVQLEREHAQRPICCHSPASHAFLAATGCPPPAL